MAKVIKAFYDASTGKLYRKGDQYNDERVDELAAGGYIAAPRKRKTKTGAEKQVDAEIEETEQ